MRADSLMNEYILLALVWSAWCALHSLLASLSVQRRVAAWVGQGFRYYRLFYNVVAILTLVPVLVFSFGVEGKPLFDWAGGWCLPQLLMIVAGILLFVLPLRQYDMARFLGLRQLRGDAGTAGLDTGGGLSTRGILGWCRHPWYAGALLLIWARELDGATLVVNTVLSLYLVVGAHLEERKLLAEFGEAYRDYQQRVPMFFPLPFRAGRKRA